MTLFDPYDPMSISPVSDGWQSYPREPEPRPVDEYDPPRYAPRGQVQDPVRDAPQDPPHDPPRSEVAVPAPAAPVSATPAAKAKPRRGLFGRKLPPEPEPLPPWQPKKGKDGKFLYPADYRVHDPARDLRRMVHPRPRDQKKAITMWWGSLRGPIVPMTYMRDGQHPFVRRHARVAMNVHLTVAASAVPTGIGIWAMVSANQDIPNLIPISSMVMVVLVWIAMAVTYHVYCAMTAVSVASRGGLYDAPAVRFLHPLPRDMREVAEREGGIPPAPPKPAPN